MIYYLPVNAAADKCYRGKRNVSDEESCYHTNSFDVAITKFNLGIRKKVSNLQRRVLQQPHTCNTRERTQLCLGWSPGYSS